MKKIISFVLPKSIENFRATVAELAENGIESMMLAVEMGDIDLLNPSDVVKAKSILSEFKIESPACHAIWGKGKDLNEASPEQREQMINSHLVFMSHAADLGAKTYVCHPGRRFADDDSKEWDLVRDTLDNLAPKAESLGIIIALENDNPGGLTDNATGLASFVDNYASPSVKICFDAGHAHQNEGAFEALSILKPFVVTAHLHDNDQTQDQHRIIGEGTIDWDKVAPLLWSCPNLVHVEIETFNVDNLPPKEVYEKYRRILGE